MVSGNIHGAVQSPAQTVRAPVQRALQIVGRGRQWERLFENGLRLRAFEPGAGEVASAGTATRGISVEQLAGIFEESEETARLVASGSVDGRMVSARGECRRATAPGNGNGTAQKPGMEPGERGLEAAETRMVLGTKGLS